MGKSLGVNWVNACTVPEKFRSITHSPEEKRRPYALPHSPQEKELTEGYPVLRAKAGAY